MGAFKVTPVVVDTNVLISALLFGGTPGKLIELWKTGTIRPTASREIIDEYLRVLAYPKFRLTENEIGYLLYREILPHFKIVIAEKGKSIVTADPSDDKFIWCALAGKARYIITSDKHLLSFRSHQGISILTPSAFLKSLFD